jgi:amino acid adenylation domain-containing protein
VVNSNYAGLSDKTVMAQASTASFDAATFEIWGPLLNGGRVLVIDRETMLSAGLLRIEIERSRVDTLFLTTALFNQMIADSPDVFESLNALLFGGEAVDNGSVTKLLSGLPPRRLLHVYGPTESTTFASWHPVENVSGITEAIPIGRPISNTQLYVLDPDMRPVQPGVPGEIYIGGDGLALGYVNQPQMTADRFVPDRHGAHPGRRLYRTGDVARLGVDGAIEFIGRSDRQVKIRGFRIEPAEVEAALRQCTLVQDSAVTVRTGVRGEPSLAAYVVPQAKARLEWKDIRKELGTKLPAYMMPSSFVALPVLPLNEHGKVDRQALPDPESERIVLGAGHVWPRTPTEEALCWIWSDLLKVPSPGIQDDFFELGGHSLLATRIASRIRYFFDVQLQVRDIFEFSTIARLARRIEAARTECDIKKPAAIIPVRRDNFPSLSFAQQRLWFLDQVEGCGAAYNIPALFGAKGSINISALEQGLSEIARRHEALRTSFPTHEGIPYQYVKPQAGVWIQTIDLSGLEASQKEIGTSTLIAAESEREFDLSSGPLLRAALLLMSERESLLLITVHHIVADGWSVNVLLSEISELCHSFESGAASTLDELPIQYPDFSSWQRAWLTGEQSREYLEYWKRQFDAGEPPAALVLDRTRPAARRYRGAVVGLKLSDQISEALQRTGFERQATPFMTFLAGFFALMQRYTGQGEVRVGTVIANRNFAEIEELIGYFANTLVLKTDVPVGSSFIDLIDRVRAAALEAYQHQDIPFEVLVDALRPERNLSDTPLFQVMFVLNRNAMPSITLPTAVLTARETQSRSSKFDLTVSVEEIGRSYAISFEYDTDIFDAVTIGRMLDHWLSMLASFSERAELLVADAPMTSASAGEMLIGWSIPATQHKVGQCLHQRFAAQASATPEAIALVCDDQHLTYEVVNTRGNQFGHYLRRRGIEPEKVVGILMERTADMIVSMLGALKAGGAYEPLDPRYPDERLAFIAGDSRLPLIVTERGLRQKLDGFPVRLVCIDTEWDQIEEEAYGDVEGAVATENMAYAIYTSGSTGRPKGVMVTHENVARLFETTRDRFRFADTDVWTQFHSAAFDFSVWEMWGALCTGAKLIVVPYMTAREPELFYQTVLKERVTVLNQTPSAFNQFALVDEHRREHIALRLVIFGGEALEFRNLRAWIERRGCREPELINMYGITETTVHVTCRTVSADDLADNRRSEIGRQIEDLGLYLMGRGSDLVPPGVPGEIRVGGGGVARGYLGKPDLTAERFLPDQHGRMGGRLYRSGDLARRTGDGEIQYLGRIDQQVKIRGYRIEPAEIESEIMKCEGVSAARVIATDDNPGGKRLVAYVVVDAGPQAIGASEVPAIRDRLRARLPDYMLPAKVIKLDRMPLTANGKVDNSSLIRFEAQAPDLPGEFLAPSGGLEQVIASIWSDVLGVDDVSAEANFFDLGGNSILMVHVRNKLRHLVGREITMVDMFTFTSIRSLANHLLVGDDNLLEVHMENDVETRTQSRRRRTQDRKTQRVNI